MPEPSLFIQFQTYQANDYDAIQAEGRVFHDLITEHPRQQLAWEEATIRHLLWPWLHTLVIATQSRFLARLSGIERQYQQDDSTGQTTIEIWQHGKLKARSIWRVAPQT